MSLTNNGSLNVVAMATATATKASGNAYAYADMITGIYQLASADVNSKATAELENTGAIDIGVQAKANGGTQATASAFMEWGISQNATSGIDYTQALLTNSQDGTLAIQAIAHASAVNGTASANAGITGTGIMQDANGSQTAEIATASLTNDNGSTLHILAFASAKASKFAFASASVTEGIEQNATANTTGSPSSTATLDNGETLDVVAQAKAHGSAASAFAGITTGISQSAINGIAEAKLDNSGKLDVFALATATGTDSFAYASADIGYGLAGRERRNSQREYLQRERRHGRGCRCRQGERHHCAGNRGHHRLGSPAERGGQARRG